MLRLVIVVAALLCALPALAGTRVVASIYPLAMIAHAVALPDTDIKLLIPSAATTHDYQPAAGDLRALAEAEVIVWAGAESEPYLVPLIAQARSDQRVITLARLPGIVWREHQLDTRSTNSSALGRDTHLWLSTRNAAVLARALGAHLGNPLAAEHFDAEMQRYRSRQSKRFAAIAHVPLLVSHDAYGYLFDEIGLRNVSAVVIDPQMPATPRRVAELAQRVERERIGCMIGEPGFEQQMAPVLFPAGHGNLVTIDPQLAGISFSRSSYTLALTFLADTLYGCMVSR